MPKRFVLDASLLEKYRVDSQTFPNDEILDDEVSYRLDKEYHCFKALLNKVKDGEAIIWYNDKVLEKYHKYADQVPSYIRALLIAILSEPNRCLMEMKTLGLTEEDSNEIEDAALQKKEIYLNLAKGLLCTNRVIVSTQKDKTNIYRKTCNLTILIHHEITCKCAEEYLKSLEQNKDV